MTTSKRSTLVRIPQEDAGWTFRDALAPTVMPSSDEPQREPSKREDAAPRYTIETMLGEGGMGIVEAVFDRCLGREVAMKTLRSERSARTELHDRFIREACVQGQLEHPSIVPVYDFAIDSKRTPYFTMKRVRGVTLEQIIIKLRESDVETTQHYGRRKLVAAFASACQAVAFAHSRGVVHRDLKPSNIMLGDFGEVYVLDWGIAKVVSAPELAPFVVTPPVTTSQTLMGTALGTLGYMAPEQLRGEEIDARADVYALGAILFEVLALERLHDGASIPAIIASTQMRVDGRPSRLRADVPPELDAICARALAFERDERFENVTDVVEALERFLDGDRDIARRRELASDHARIAVAAGARAVDADDVDARSVALREAARALALDPENSVATETLVRLLTQPPQDMPNEAIEALHAEAEAAERATARGALVGYLAWFAFIPFGFWMGVRSVRLALLSALVWAVAALLANVAMRRSRSSSPVMRTAAVLATACAASIMCVVCGPYVLVPTLAVINVVLWLLVSTRRWRPFVIALGALTVLVPAMLEWVGLARFYNFRDGHVTILQGMLDFHPVATHVLLTAASLGLVAVAAILVTRVRDTLDDAERRLHVQTWQLKQLVPRASGDR